MKKGLLLWMILCLLFLSSCSLVPSVQTESRTMRNETDSAIKPNDTTAITDPETEIPTTVVPVTLPDMDLSIAVYPSDGGTVQVTSTEEGATLSASANDGFFSLYWSKGGLLSNGGELLGTEESLNLDRSEDGITLCLYFGSVGTSYLYYDLAGGETNDGATHYFDTYTSDFFLYPNTLPDTGLIQREGYTLLEFNTSSDGTGESVNLGGKLCNGDNCLHRLFAVWEQWTPATDFTFSEIESGLSLTSYTGNAETLCIPEKVGETPVIQIVTGAVVGKSFSTLVIPKTVVEIQNGAFSECLHFDKLYISDTVLQMTDAAFSNCRAFRTLCYNAASAPVYGQNFFGGCTIKYELLRTPTDKKTLMTLGGSSMVYGLNSPMLEELLGGEYRVINYGTNQGTCGLFYAEVASHYLKEGDIFLHAPEYGGVQCGLAFSWKTVRETEYCYNIYRDADMSHYSSVLSSISECNRDRAKLSAGTYLDQSGQLNGNGDGIDNTEHKLFSYSPTTTVSSNSLTIDRAKAFRSTYAFLSAQKVTLLFSFPPFLSGSLKNNSDLDGYAKAIADNLPITVISAPSDYLFQFSDMYDSNYHLTTESAKVRTEKLAADILSFLNTNLLETE